MQEINLGTGRGTSVLELVNLFEKETGIKIHISLLQGVLEIMPLHMQILPWQNLY